MPLAKPLFGKAAYQARGNAAPRLCIDLGPRTNAVHERVNRETLRELR